ncbi:hypothetical protein [Nocardioides bigeumensis]|uniref:hypothetical protein n=1 Tax=Nocardioides bigeumensis TaxID=433657 RepID=UPI0031D090C0
MPAEIAVGWRLSLGIGGAALLVVAAVATLSADNELGAAALALVGALFLVTSGLGRWPSKLTWGDKSAEWRDRVVQHAIDAGADSEELAEVVESVATTPQEHLLAQQLRTTSPRGTTRAGAVERVAMEASRLELVFVHSFEPGPSDTWDGRIVMRPDDGPDRSVAVVTSIGEVIGTGVSHRIAQRVLDAQRAGFRAVLIVLENAVPRAQQDILAHLIGEVTDGAVAPRLFWGGASGGGVTQLRGNLRRIADYLAERRAD